MRAPIIFLSLLSFALIGCQNLSFTPTSPSDIDYSNNSQTSLNVKQTWSPYMVVHVTGEAFDAYKDILLQMAQQGTLRGVRIGTDKSEKFNNYVADMIRGIPGIDILFIIDNYYLFDSNLEEVIDDAFRKYPDIRYFQIGNEITTILPKSGPTMNIEQYMIALKRIYNHVQTNHPGRAILVSQATFGSGTYGAEELEKMARLGLTEMSLDKIIVGINCYTHLAASQYAGVINGPLRRYRVWVTETGTNDPEQHMSFILNEYPKLRNYLRPERIYWYALWTGDGEYENHTDFGLIRYPSKYPDYFKTPLLKILLGQQ